MGDDNKESVQRFSAKVKKILIASGFGFMILLFLGLTQMGTPSNQNSVQVSEDNSKNTGLKPNDLPKVRGQGESGVVSETLDEIPPQQIPPQNEPDKKDDTKDTQDPPLDPKPSMLGGEGRPPAKVEEKDPIEEQRKQWLAQLDQQRGQNFLTATNAKINVSVTLNTPTNNAAYDQAMIDTNGAIAQPTAFQAGALGTGSTSGETLDVSDYDRAMNGMPPRSAPNMTVAGQQSYAGFKNKDSWASDQVLEEPTNKYSVRAGVVIPAVLISGINSDLPGQIIAQVSQNVWDSGTGKYLLIPQGTRLIGTYSSGITYGQERVMIGWQRLIYPDNRALDLGSMPGTDVSGYSGFSDQVNNHWWKLIANSFLMSGIVAAVAVSVDSNNNNSNSSNSSSTNVSDTLRSTLASQFGGVIANVIQRNLNVSPTLEVRPGYRFNVMVTKDLTFKKPYKLFDYKVR